MICDLCHGDGWITDTYDFLARCKGVDEECRFMERVGSLGGAMAGRMACPRCRTEWKPSRFAAEQNIK